MKNTNEQLERLLEITDYLLAFTSKSNGFDVISGSVSNDRQYFALKAIGNSATLGAGTTTINGDSPDAGDTIQQGDTLYGSFDDVEVTSGKVYAYYRNA
jgi:hypothetical protein